MLSFDGEDIVLENNNNDIAFASVFLQFFIYRLVGTAETYSKANSSRCWMTPQKKDENGVIWMNFWRQEFFFWIKISAEIGQR